MGNFKKGQKPAHGHTKIPWENILNASPGRGADPTREAKGKIKVEGGGREEE